MKDPCKGCLVSACCSKRCKDFAIYVYTTKQYTDAGANVSKQIDEMPYEEAINHILNVEDIYLHLKVKTTEPL